MDFTLKNENVKAFFEGTTEAPPVSEMMYLHEHPLVRPNFLVEIEKYISACGNILESRGVSGGKHLERLTQVAIEMGQILANLTRLNAEQFLRLAKEACDICKKLTGKQLM